MQSGANYGCPGNFNSRISKLQALRSLLPLFSLLVCLLLRIALCLWSHHPPLPKHPRGFWNLFFCLASTHIPQGYCCLLLPDTWAWRDTWFLFPVFGTTNIWGGTGENSLVNSCICCPEHSLCGRNRCWIQLTQQVWEECVQKEIFWIFSWRVAESIFLLS